MFQFSHKPYDYTGIFLYGYLFLYILLDMNKFSLKELDVVNIITALTV